MSILNYFKGTPRVHQKEVLLELERSWYQHDIFVLEAPVAYGKSNVAHCISKWIGNSVILTPTNILLNQYSRDFNDIKYLWRKDIYCKRDCKLYRPNNCKRKDCPYKTAKKELLDSNSAAVNYYTYIALRKNNNWRRNTIIIDEAHNLIPTLTDLASLNIWQCVYKYPDKLYTEADILNWLEENKLTKQKKWKPIVESLYSNEPSYKFEHTTDYYRGHKEKVIKVKPIAVKNYYPIMWPWCVNKIVLMSATINHNDIKELGLDRRRIKYIKAESPIPPINRPVIYEPLVSASIKKQNKSAKIISNKLLEYLDTYKGKGIIHCTYGLAAKLKKELYHPRLIWHDKLNKDVKYREYLSREDDCVLMACGLTEGIDLPADLGRWQIIVKVPYMNLADTAIEVKAKLNPEWYKWEAIKAIIQASGRISRTPTDFGLTKIIDKDFELLYYNNKKLFPSWFKEALILKEKI